MRKLSVRHAPRRAAAWSGGRNRSGGFTLLEVLLTVAILVILLGLSTVGVARYKDHLKIAELDNAARDIYMAAENRAVLLQNSGQLGTASATLMSSGNLIEVPDIDGGSDIEVYALSSSDNAGELEVLLPTGVIDPALRDGQFFALYDESTHHVREVFYTEKPDSITKDNLNNFRVGRSGRVAYFRGDKSSRSLVGWYAGGAAEEIGTKPLPAPGVEVLITNGNELTLTVRYTMPTVVDESGNPLAVTRTPSVTLKYGGEEVELLYVDAATKTIASPYSGRLTDDTKSSDIAGTASATYTWVLDSLRQDGGTYTQQFKELIGASVELGDDFTVTAALTLTAPGYIDSAYYATGTDNSLFAKGSTYGADGTAQIANLRHLQNLHPGHSNAGTGAVNALQLVDIDCEKALDNNGNVLDPNYNFIPIVNDTLTSYNGRNGTKNTHIFNLSTIEAANAGLFGTVSHNLAIENCRVCWKDGDSGKMVTASPKAIDYKVKGTDNAGGLIGLVSGGEVTIKNSFAATTVKATDSASNVGGLVGSVTGGELTVEHSYADCYLNGVANVGGLVGSGTVAKLDCCYAAGFIVNPTTNTNTAGLLNGSVTNASNTYSVVRTIGGDSLGYPVKPLYDDVSNSVSGNVRYLNDTSTAFNPAADVFTAAGTSETHVYNLRYKLSENPDDELKTRYPFRGLKDTEGHAIPHYGDWCSVLPAVIRGMVYYEEYYHEGNTDTDAYGVPNDSNYVGAEGKFVVGGNNYSDFSSYPLWKDFGNTDTAKNNPVVVRDGYALLFMGGSVSLGKYEVEYGGTQKWTLQNKQTPNGMKLMWTCEWTAAGEGKYGETPPDEEARSFTLPRDVPKEPDACKDLPEDNYVLVLLPDAVVTGNFAYGDSFYQKLTASKVGDAAESGENAAKFYFNPLFAKTVETADKTAALTAGTNPDKVSIRTARHLYDLSRLYDTRGLYNDDEFDEDDRDFIKGDGANNYIKNNYYNKGYSFLQELDIDYDTYTWYGAIPAKMEGTNYRVQHPIGVGIFGLQGEGDYLYLNADFKGNYDGGCHIIRNVIFRGTGYYIGLFGMTGKYGVNSDIPSRLENIVYEMDPAVTVTFYSSDTAGRDPDKQDKGHFRTIGALVGKNDGVISNCAVYGVNMDARGKYIGGLLGYNQNTVTNCAAEVASLTVTLFNDTSEVSCAGGLVGKQLNGNCKIENSYAVGKLISSNSSMHGNGEAIAGLVAHQGKLSNSYAAVDLVVNSTGVDRFGLCRNAGTGVVDATNSYWLKDVFVYRGEKYNITSTTDLKDSDRGVTFATLKTNLSSIQPTAQNTVLNIPAGASYTSTYEGKDFPYLTGVKTTLARDRSGKITGKVTSKPIHYGLWPAPLPVGLAYYEEYDDGTYGANGQYENLRLYNLKEDTDNPVVKKDGYALVFEGTDVPVGDYAVKYGNGTTTKEFTLTKTADDWKWNGWTYADYVYTVTVDSVDYTLVALPHSVVTGTLSEGDVKTAKYFQKLVYGEGLFTERTFYFNPHFAGRLVGEAGETVLRSVVAGTVADNAEYTAPGRPAEPKNGSIQQNAGTIMDFDKVQRACEPNAISVRTPRHFYALSRYQEAYSVENKTDTGNERYHNFKRYYFKQGLNLDYTTYTWYGEETPESVTPSGGTTYYTQDPIGKGGWRPKPANPDPDWDWDWVDDGFKGIYDGGNHTIKGVIYNTNTIEDKKSENFSKMSDYVGLFRYAEYLWNIHYEVPDGAVVKLENTPQAPVMNKNGGLVGNVKIGTLVGGTFLPKNCSVTIHNLTITSSSNADIYVGGLLGYGNETRNCHAEITGTLKVTGGGNVHVGGLQGMVFNQVEDSSSTVNTLIVEGPKDCYAGGLAGCSTIHGAAARRRLDNCYAEVTALRVISTGNGVAYGGGLAGWCDTILKCTVVVKDSLLVGSVGSNDSYGGGLTGGATEIKSCVSIARSVKVVKVENTNGTYTPTNTGIGYVGGLVGFVKQRSDIIPIESDGKTLHTLVDRQVGYSYAAAASIVGGANGHKDPFVGGKENGYYPSFSYPYYLHDKLNGATGAATAPWYLPTSHDEWTTGTDYVMVRDSTGGNDQGRARTCAQLMNGSGNDALPGLTGTGGMGFVPGDNAYPYPVATKKDGQFYYPSDIWPVLVGAASPTALASEDPDLLPESDEMLPESEEMLPESEELLPEPEELPPEAEALLPEPGALPPEPEELPEPEDQADEPEPEPEDESEPTD